MLVNQMYHYIETVDYQLRSKWYYALARAYYTNELFELATRSQVLAARYALAARVFMGNV